MLAQFLFTTSETELDCYQQKMNGRVAVRDAGQVKTSPMGGLNIHTRKKNLGSWEIRKFKTQILTFFGKKSQKSAVNHSIQKVILLNFMNLLSEETDFQF